MAPLIVVTIEVVEWLDRITQTKQHLLVEIWLAEHKAEIEAILTTIETEDILVEVVSVPVVELKALVNHLQQEEMLELPAQQERFQEWIRLILLQLEKVLQDQVVIV